MNRLQASAFGHFLEVPVTRRAAVTRIGALIGRFHRWRLVRDAGILACETDGAQVAVKSPTGEFRAGLGRCVGDDLYLEGVASACEGDLVYRVEPA